MRPLTIDDEEIMFSGGPSVRQFANTI